MKKLDAEKLLRRVRLELARDRDFPNGSSERGYDLIAPLDAKGHIVLAAWKELQRPLPRAPLLGRRGQRGRAHRTQARRRVAFHYDIHGDPSHDESGFRFEHHAFLPGEYVSIREQDDVLRTFRVVSVREIE